MACKPNNNMKKAMGNSKPAGGKSTTKKGTRKGK